MTAIATCLCGHALAKSLSLCPFLPCPATARMRPRAPSRYSCLLTWTAPARCTMHCTGERRRSFAPVQVGYTAPKQVPRSKSQLHLPQSACALRSSRSIALPPPLLCAGTTRASRASPQPPTWWRAPPCRPPSASARTAPTAPWSLRATSVCLLRWAGWRLVLRAGQMLGEAGQGREGRAGARCR